MGEFTSLLDEWSKGDPKAFERLYMLVLPDIRNLARKIGSRYQQQGAQTTEVVNALFIKILKSKGRRPDDRVAFWKFMARCMRNHMLDLARGAKDQVTAEDYELVARGKSDILIAIEEALPALEKRDPFALDVFQLKFYWGLTADEIAEQIGWSKRKVDQGFLDAKEFLEPYVARFAQKRIGRYGRNNGNPTGTGEAESG